jgi:hypothetical protein
MSLKVTVTIEIDMGGLPEMRISSGKESFEANPYFFYSEAVDLGRKALADVLMGMPEETRKYGKHGKEKS